MFADSASMEYARHMLAGTGGGAIGAGAGAVNLQGFDRRADNFGASNGRIMDDRYSCLVRI